MIKGDPGALAHKIDDFAKNIPGYRLLITIIGYNPVLRRKVPRTAKNFVRGFMGIVPGGEVLYQRLEKSGAIDNALKWLEGVVKAQNISLAGILADLKAVWDEVRPNLWKFWNWGKYIGMFLGVFKRPIVALFNIGKAIVGKVAEWVFTGVMRMIAGEKNEVMGVINKGKAVLTTIINDPIGFIKNLVNAVKLGLKQFVKNIWKHLLNGIMGWLFGTFSEAGIELPKKFDIKGIFFLIAQILGITWRQLRPKIVKRLGPHGEKIMTFIEKAVDFVVTLVVKSPLALWEKVKEMLGNLKDMVLGAIIGWVRNTIITKAIEKLISFFNPAGAIIQAIIAIYNTVMWVYEHYKQIKAFVQSVIDSIAQVAMGKIGPEANYIEQSIAKAIPVIISFLARLIGLGGISKKIQDIIKKIRAPIDKAIDKVLDWIVAKGKALWAKISGKEKQQTPLTKEEHDRQVKAGLIEIEKLENQYDKDKDGDLTFEDANEIASQVKSKFPVFKVLKVVDGGETWDYDYVASPENKKKGKKKKR